MQINDIEWSGILFYSIEGSIQNPSKMKITIEDILPMDRGSSVFTEYEFDERFVDYLMEDPKHMDYYVGHVHSHHSMKVFFSSTDTEELVDNSAAHNFYLSLIVNNHMDFTAKVAFRGTAEIVEQEVPLNCLNEKGEPYQVGTTSLSAKKEKIFVYDCDIKSKAKGVKVPTTFSQRVKKLFKKKEPKGSSWQRNNNFGGNTKAVPAVDNMKNFSKMYTGPNLEDMFDDDDDPYADAEIFVAELLYEAIGVSKSKASNIDEAVEAIDRTKMMPMQLAKKVSEILPDKYDHTYPKATEEDVEIDLQLYVDILEERSIMCPKLKNTLEVVKLISVKTFE